MVQKMALHGTNGAIPPKSLKLLGSMSAFMVIQMVQYLQMLQKMAFWILKFLFVPTTGLCESESWPEGF